MGLTFHLLLFLFFEIPLAGRFDFGIHEGLTRSREINVIQTRPRLTQAKNGQSSRLNALLNGAQVIALATHHQIQRIPLGAINNHALNKI